MRASAGHYLTHKGQDMAQTQQRYEAVTAQQLMARLGNQCSPMRDRQGYVIGPDIEGRICHIASCFSMHEAQEAASRMNAA